MNTLPIPTASKRRYFEKMPDFAKERTQKFVNIVFTLFTLSFFGLFAINPTLATIVKLKKELADNERVDKELQQKITNLSSLQEKYSLIQNDIPLVLSAVPKIPEIPLLMAEIQAVAQVYNIQIDSFQSFTVELFKEEGGGKDKQHYSYSFSLSGTGVYQNIASFLSRIVNMQRIVVIDTFVIDRTKEKGRGLKFSLQGLAYYK